ncbi:MAG: hypothetical protein VW268_07180 [Rhodospirillaceae bacterium]
MADGYGKTAEIAKNGSLAERMVLAADPETQPQILYFLTNEPAPGVCRRFAGNKANPAQADDRLAKDEDPEVRETLGGKISKMLPGIADKQKIKVRKWATDTLEEMSRDQALRVRHVLAERLGIWMILIAVTIEVVDLALLSPNKWFSVSPQMKYAEVLVMFLMNGVFVCFLLLFLKNVVAQKEAAAR